MRRLLFAAFIFCTPLLNSALAQKQAQAPVERLGVGVMFGEPTGLNVKRWLSDTIAIDGGLAWSFQYNSSYHLHADYLIHRYDWLMPRNLKGTLPVYYGIGGRMKFESEGDEDEPNDDATLIGLRLPLGMNFLPYAGPYDAFFEVTPVVDIAPQVDLTFNAAIGIRLYFR